MNFSWAIHFGQDLAEAAALGFHSTIPLLFAGDSRAGAWQKKQIQKIVSWNPAVHSMNEYARDDPGATSEQRQAIIQNKVLSKNRAASPL